MKQYPSSSTNTLKLDPKPLFSPLVLWQPNIQQSKQICFLILPLLAKLFMNVHTITIFEYFPYSYTCIKFCISLSKINSQLLEHQVHPHSRQKTQTKFSKPNILSNEKELRASTDLFVKRFVEVLKLRPWLHSYLSNFKNCNFPTFASSPNI